MPENQQPNAVQRVVVFDWENQLRQRVRGTANVAEYSETQAKEAFGTTTPEFDVQVAASADLSDLLRMVEKAYERSDTIQGAFIMQYGGKVLGAIGNEEFLTKVRQISEILNLIVSTPA